MKPKCPSMIKARPTRNGKDASDLIAALVSNVRALQNQAFATVRRPSPATLENRRHAPAPPIAFITKFKAPMPAFGFFGRKTGYIVANRGGRVAEHDSNSAVESD